MAYFKFLFALSLLTLLHVSYQLDTCAPVKCKKMENQTDICINPQSEGAVIMQECPEGKVCNALTDDPTQSATCVFPTIPVIKRYAGLNCTTSKECFSGNCLNGVCTGIPVDAICTSVEECEYGLTCRKATPDATEKTCIKPITTMNERCEEDTDCDRTMGCLNNTCTEYFSKEDGESIGEHSTYLLLSFCKSGYSNSEGICQTLRQNQPKTTCDEFNPCKYYLSGSSSERVILPDKCQCGFNPNGVHYCELGSGEKNYTRYINYLKDYFLNTGNCHLGERGGEGCVKDFLEQDTNPSIKERLQKLYNFKLWALSNYELYDADQCVYKIEFNKYDPTMDEPEEDPTSIKSCAAYKCIDDTQTTEQYCAKTTYMSSNEINVDLVNRCKDDEYCNIGGSPNEVFYEEKNSTFICAKTETPKAQRYPGEECETDDDCTLPVELTDDKFHKCESGKCTGYDTEHACTSSVECVVGHFCSKEQKKCIKLIKENGACTDTYQCENNLLCFEGICQNVLYSFTAGTILQGVMNNQEKYCDSGMALNNVCVEIRDQETKDGYQECKADEECKYMYYPFVFGTFTQECECGYNAERKGYCKQYHDHNKDAWKSYFNVLKDSYKNTCHTLNRYTCYEKEKEVKNDLQKYEKIIERNHLYQGGVDCASDVLSSGFVKVNSVILAVVMIVNLFL